MPRGRLLPAADAVHGPVHGVVVVLPRVLHALSVSGAHARVPPVTSSQQATHLQSHCSLFTLGGSVLLWVTTVNEHYTELQLVPIHCILPKPGWPHIYARKTYWRHIHMAEALNPRQQHTTNKWLYGKISSATEQLRQMAAYNCKPLHRHTDQPVSIWYCGKVKLDRCSLLRGQGGQIHRHEIATAWLA